MTREFRGATFEVEMRREPGISHSLVAVDGKELSVNRLTDIQAGKTYNVEVRIPASIGLTAARVAGRAS